MDDLYFLGADLERVQQALAQPQSAEELERLQAKLIGLQERCPHWDMWKKPNPNGSGQDICTFCIKDWAEVMEEKKKALQELKRRAQEIHGSYRIVWQSIEALKESCSHPKEHIENEKERTYCKRCDTTLWSRGMRGWLVTLSPEDLADIPGALKRFGVKEAELKGEIVRLQVECPHPEAEKVFDAGDHDCGICGLAWIKVLDRREALSQMSKV